MFLLHSAIHKSHQVGIGLKSTRMLSSLGRATALTFPRDKRGPSSWSTNLPASTLLLLSALHFVPSSRPRSGAVHATLSQTELDLHANLESISVLTAKQNP